MNDVLYETGQSLFTWIVAMNVWCAVLLAGILVIDHLLRHKLSAGWRIALYATLALRLAFPVAWDSPLALLTQESTLAPSVPTQHISLQHDANVQREDASEAAIPSATPQGAGDGITWTSAVPIAYAFGVGLLGLMWLGARWRLHCRIKRAAPARSSIASVASDHKILELPGVGPALVGVLLPKLVVPTAMARAVEDGTMSRLDARSVLEHEIAHLKRRDHWTLALMQITVIAFWPIAALWFASWRVRNLLEIAADEHALRDATMADRRAYGATLLQMTESLTSPPRPRLANLGLLGHVRRPLGARLRAIVSPSRKWPGFAQVGVLAGLAALLVACTTTRPPMQVAATDPAGESTIQITIRVLETWPEHEKLDFRLAQTEADGELPEHLKPLPPEAHRMRPDEWENYMNTVRAAPEAQIIIEPRLLVFEDQTGRVEVTSDQNEDPRIAIDLTPHINADGTITIDLNYIARGLHARPPASDLEDGDQNHANTTIRNLPDRSTQFVLATGYIGTPIHLLAVTAEKTDHSETAGIEQARDEIAINTGEVDDPLPAIEYYLVMWDVPAEPPFDELLDESPQRTVFRSPADEIGWIGFPTTREEQRIFDWLGDHGEYRFGGKDGARLADSDEPVGYNLPAGNLGETDIPGGVIRLDPDRNGDVIKLTIDWTDATHASVLNGPANVTVRPDHSLFIAAPVGNGTWRTILIRATPADPTIFRGQTASDVIIESAEPIELPGIDE